MLRSTYQPIRGLLARIEDEGTMQVPALLTGFNPLDSVLDGGFHPHDLILVAGRPAVGKTVCTLQWARTIAESGGHVAYVSYEHSEQSLLGRILQMELCEFVGLLDERTTDLVRRAIRAWCNGRITIDRLLRVDPCVEAIYERLLTYASRLYLIRGAAGSTDLDELGNIARHLVGAGGLLIVDYLQKVPAPSTGVAALDHSAPEIAAGLKEIAMTDHVAVVAIASVGDLGLAARRVRPQHLSSGAALLHECDVAMILNEKAPALSRIHTAFDGRNVDEAKHWTLFSVEKQREGVSGVDLEFRKEFDGFRFSPFGGVVGEHLIDDLKYEE
jgi:replicative DNA helicase